MVNVCCVVGCMNSSQKGFQMHRFPNDSKLCNEWLTSLRRFDLKNKSLKQIRTSYRVCDAHFGPEAIYPGSRSKSTIKKDAVPSLNLSFEILDRGKEEIYVTKWFAFPRMAFLLDKDKDKARNTVDSDTIDDSVQENSNAEANYESVAVTNYVRTELEEDTKETEAEAPPLASKPSTTVTLAKQLRKRKRPDEPVETSVDEALRLLKKAATNNELKSDECGVYGQHIAHKLRSYSKKTRAIVQHQINNIIFNADMGHFDTGEAINGPQYSISSLPIQIPQQQFPIVIPVPSASRQTQPNIIPEKNPTPHSQLSNSNQPSTPSQTPVNDIEEVFVN